MTTRKAPPSERAGVLTVTALKRDLADVAKVDAALSRGALAMAAMRAAEELDNPGVSATAKSMLIGQLRDTMTLIRGLMPQAAAEDDLDDLSARRAARLAGRSTPAS